MIEIGADFSTNGVSETGLTPTIIIRDISDGSIVVNGVNVPEVGGGAYKYDFTNDTAKNYRAIIDGGLDTLDSRYLTAWSERAKAEAEIVETNADVLWLIKIVTNKKELKKAGSVWELIIYDDDNIAEILNKAIKDKDGCDITDLQAGVLAQEIASSV